MIRVAVPAVDVRAAALLALRVAFLRLHRVACLVSDFANILKYSARVRHLQVLNVFFKSSVGACAQAHAQAHAHARA